MCIFDCNNHSVLCKIHSVVNFTKNISLSGAIGPLHSISGVKGLTHAWSITKIRLFKSIENFTTKKSKVLDKNSDIFLISAQKIYCGYSLELPWRGASNKYPQSMFLSRNKKNNVYPCKPQFYYIKVGFKGGGQNYIGMFS